VSTPIVLIPGLNCSARVYAEQIPGLWGFGPVMIADHTRHDSMAAIAQSILAEAPPHFALVGFSMGGYIAFEIMRQAPERVMKLALLDTAARSDQPEQTARRDQQIALARAGRFPEVSKVLFPLMVHSTRRQDPALKEVVERMAQETGPEAFIRQQTAIKGRPDSRPLLRSIRCPTLVLVGEQDELTPPDRAKEMAEGVSGAKLVIVPQCGHLSTLEQPLAVNETLGSWLRG
jgi:pimeloyl-ACP methyl ester carboxylesterase